MTNPVQADDKVLCDLARRMGEAERSRDDAFFRTLLAEKLTFRRASGAVVDKATFLNDLLNPENTYDLLESEDVSATVHEGVAVVTSADDLREERIGVRSCYVNIYRKTGGEDLGVRRQLRTL